MKNVEFANAEEGTIFDKEEFEAIVGLGYPEAADGGVSPLMDTVMKQHLLTSNVFSFYLPPLKDKDKKPEVTLGYYDKSKFTGDIDWHAVKLKYMFGVRLDDIKVNGKPLGICKTLNKPCTFAIDSGMTHMSVPPQSLKRFKEANVPIGTNMVECDRKEDIGSLTYVLNGKDYTFSADEWLDYKTPKAGRVSFTQGVSRFGSTIMLG